MNSLLKKIIIFASATVVVNLVVFGIFNVPTKNLSFGTLFMIYISLAVLVLFVFYKFKGKN